MNKQRSIFVVATIVMSLLSSRAVLVQDVAPDPWPSQPQDEVERTAADLDWTEGLEAGLLAAQTQGLPVLVFITTRDCIWCRTLEREMEQPELSELLGQWSLVRVDAERFPSDARRLGATGFPALRVLQPGGQRVAGHEGYLSSEELAAWLSDHRAAATAALDTFTSPSIEANEATVARLVSQLDERDPLVRAAAIGRLAAVPRLASLPVIEVLRDGNLAARLASLEVLDRWDAPIAALDPWRPESITDDRLGALLEWQHTLTDATETEVEPATPLSPERMAEAHADFDRLMRLELLEGEPLRTRLARFGEALLPEVYARLQQVETDAERQRLLALRYRLVASDRLVLRWPGGLVRLASPDAVTRRTAAEQLAARARAEDQPLLLELFSDPDPMIRESSLRGLYRIGGSEAMAALVRLLRDPEPSVRAAVLKQLAEAGDQSLITEVAQYAAGETDDELLVHAIRYFREAKGEGAVRPLIALVEHESWQVRAEATEALGKALDYGFRQSHAELAAEAQAAIEARLEDADAFVVSRALEAIPSSSQSVKLERMIAVADRHPELKLAVVSSVADVARLLQFGPDLAAQDDQMPAMAKTYLKSALTDDAPTIRAAAVRGLYRVDPMTIGEWVIECLGDEAGEVRLAAVSAITQDINRLLDAKSRELIQYDGFFLGGRHIERFEFERQEYEPAPAADSLLGRLAQSLFGSRDAEPRAVPHPPAAVEEDVPESVVEAQPPGAEDAAANVADHRWEKWLSSFHGGTGRPEWADAALPLLRELLESSQTDERLHTAVVLAALEENPQALRILLESAESQPVWHIAAALPWLTFERRAELFRALAPQTADAEAVHHLAEAMSAAPVPHTAELWWELLGEYDIDLQSIHEAVRALVSAYSGQRYFYYELPESVVPSARRDAEQRIASGPAAQRRAALVILTLADSARALDAARTIYHDPELVPLLRRDALDVLLLRGTRDDQSKMLASALSETDATLLLSALALLAEGPSRLGERGTFRLDSALGPTLSNSTQQGRLRAEVTVEQLRPLLEHADSEVRAYAGFLLALKKVPDGMPALIEHWRTFDSGNYLASRWRNMLIEAIAELDDAQYIELLREVYDQLQPHEQSNFRSTVRLMRAPGVREMMRELPPISPIR